MAVSIGTQHVFPTTPGEVALERTRLAAMSPLVREEELRAAVEMLGLKIRTGTQNEPTPEAATVEAGGITQIEGTDPELSE